MLSTNFKHSSNRVIHQALSSELCETAPPSDVKTDVKNASSVIDRCSKKNVATKTVPQSCWEIRQIYRKGAKDANGKGTLQKEEEKTKKQSCDNTAIHKCPTNFSEPKLLTSLKIIESFQSLIETDVKKESSSQPGVSVLPKKGTRKVNIPFEEKVYKGLIELKVNDEDLGINSNIPFKPKEIVKVKEPEPVLSDYYTPKFDKEYVIKPQLPEFEISKFKMPPVPSVLEVTKRWEPEEFY